MFSNLYSLPQERFVSADEIHATHFRARRSMRDYYHWVQTYLPLCGDPVAPELVKSCRTRFTIKEYGYAVHKHTTSRTFDGLSKHTSTNRPSIVTTTLQRANMSCGALFGPVTAVQANIFQRHFAATHTIDNGETDDGVVGGVLHADATLNELFAQGRINVFANIVAPEDMVDISLPVDIFGLNIAQMTDIGCTEYLELRQRLRDDGFSYGMSTYVEDRIAQTGGYYKLQPNRWHIFFDGVPHVAGLLDKKAISKLSGLQSERIVTSVNLDMDFMKRWRMQLRGLAPKLEPKPMPCPFPMHSPPMRL